MGTQFPPQIHPRVADFIEKPRSKMLINGKWVNAASGKDLSHIQSRYRRSSGQVAEGDREDIEHAVKAARQAFDHGPWRRMDPHPNEVADLEAR